MVEEAHRKSRAEAQRVAQKKAEARDKNEAGTSKQKRSPPRSLSRNDKERKKRRANEPDGRRAPPPGRAGRGRGGRSRGGRPGPYDAGRGRNRAFNSYLASYGPRHYSLQRQAGMFAEPEAQPGPVVHDHRTPRKFSDGRAAWGRKEPSERRRSPVRRPATDRNEGREARAPTVKSTVTQVPFKDQRSRSTSRKGRPERRASHREDTVPVTAQPRVESPRRPVLENQDRRGRLNSPTYSAKFNPYGGRNAESRRE